MRGRISYSNAMSTIAVFIALGGGAYAVTSSSSSKTIRACASKSTGRLRLLAHGKCHSSERTVRWNQIGPRGLTGPPGAPGAAGAAGAAAQSPTNADTLDHLDSTDLERAFKATIVVSPGATDTAGGQNLRDAITQANAASGGANRIVYVEPGTYDVGSQSSPVAIGTNVTVRGAGTSRTLIKGSGSGSASDALLELAGSAELADLTVSESTSAVSYTNATAVAFDSASVNRIFRNVNITAGQATSKNVGIDLAGGEVTLLHSVVSASAPTGGTSNATGILTHDANDLVVLNDSSQVSAGGFAFNALGILASGFTQVLGGSSVTASATVSANSVHAIEVPATNTGGLAVRDSTISASTGPAGNTIGIDALDRMASSSFFVQNSRLFGNPALSVGASMTALVTSSEFDTANRTAGTGTFKCFGDYNGSQGSPAFTALTNPATCGP